MRLKQTVPYYIVFITFFICASCKHKNAAPSIDIVLRGNLEISDKKARAIFERGLRFIEEGDYGTARKRFFEANRECPNNPTILNAIGSTFSQTGNPDLGNTYFERALKIDSNFINSYANFGASLNLTMRLDEAKQVLRLGLARDSKDSSNRSLLFLNLANSYFLNKEYDSALEFIDSTKRNAGHGRVYNLALQAQSEVNIRMPQPATRR